MWERRTSINLQLMEKENTDIAMLTKSILLDQTTDEFFLSKKPLAGPCVSTVRRIQNGCLHS